MTKKINILILTVLLFVGFIFVDTASAATKEVYVWPSSARMVTQYFKYGHPAIDIYGIMRASIYSAADGKVIDAKSEGYNGGFGKYIVVQDIYGRKER